MAKDIKFNIKGINEVKRLLDKLPESVNEKIQLDLHKRAAKIVKEEIANRAPDNPATSSGDKIENNVVIVKAPEAKSSVWVSLTKRVFYAKFIERGVSFIRKKGSGKETGSLPRKPFVEPAHDVAFPKVVQFLQENYLKLVLKSIKSQSKKLAGKNRKK